MQKSLEVAGITAEIARFSVDTSTANIRLPQPLQAWRERLMLTGDVVHEIPAAYLIDIRPGNVASLSGKCSQGGIFLFDTAQQDPRSQYPGVPLQLCKLSLDRFGQIKSMYISTDKDRFVKAMGRFGQVSSLAAELGGIKIPETFPAGISNFELFQALRDVHIEDGDRHISRFRSITSR